MSAACETNPAQFKHDCCDAIERLKVAINETDILWKPTHLLSKKITVYESIKNTHEILKQILEGTK